MIKDKNLRLYEALAHEVAMDAAARRELTDEQREQSRRLLAYTHEHVARLERAKRKPAVKKVRDEIAALSRPSPTAPRRPHWNSAPYRAHVSRPRVDVG